MKAGRDEKRLHIGGGKANCPFDRLRVEPVRLEQACKISHRAGDNRQKRLAARGTHQAFAAPHQKRIAEEVITKLNAARVFPGKIVTEVTQASTFYPAEAYHQDYFANNPFQPYCQAVAAPKVEKVRKVFKDLVK